VIRRVVAIVVTGVALYLVLPSLAKVFGAWPELSKLEPAWLAAGLACEVGSWVCNISLQRMILRRRGWFGVSVAALTSKAVTNVLPGGDAAGAAVQYSMLTATGTSSEQAAGAMAAVSFVGIGGLLSMPLLTLPAVIAGVKIKPSLLRLGAIGLVAFGLFAIGGVLLLATDTPLRLVGRGAEWLVNHFPGHHRISSGLDDRLLAQRDEVRSTLGRHWRQAVLLTGGRLGLDYLCLLAAVRSTGSDANPFAVLVAYVAAQLVALLPFTPGGLGLVEASLTGLLVLVGLTPARAVVATLAYRLAQYWLPTAVGGVAYVLFRHRYGRLPQAPPGVPPRGGGDARSAGEPAG